jgi:predicted enzyme related to lactoylglutathione lyase
MQILGLSTVVLVHEMDRALRFYHKTLGLTLVEEEDDWAQFAEGIVLMLSPEPLPADNLSLNAVSISLQVADAAEAFNHLTSNGVAFLVPPTDVGGAVVASFRDSEGNLLQLLQREV